MQVHKEPHRRGIPIVVVRAGDNTEENRQRLRDLVVGRLEKRGFAPEELLEQVRELVTRTGG